MWDGCTRVNFAETVGTSGSQKRAVEIRAQCERWVGDHCCFQLLDVVLIALAERCHGRTHFVCIPADRRQFGRQFVGHHDRRTVAGRSLGPQFISRIGFDGGYSGLLGNIYVQNCSLPNPKTVPCWRLPACPCWRLLYRCGSKSPVEHRRLLQGAPSADCWPRAHGRGTNCYLKAPTSDCLCRQRVGHNLV